MNSRNSNFCAIFIVALTALSGCSNDSNVTSSAAKIDDSESLGGQVDSGDSADKLSLTTIGGGRCGLLLKYTQNGPVWNGGNTVACPQGWYCARSENPNDDGRFGLCQRPHGKPKLKCDNPEYRPGHMSCAHAIVVEQNSGTLPGPLPVPPKTVGGSMSPPSSSTPPVSLPPKWQSQLPDGSPSPKTLPPGYYAEPSAPRGGVEP